MSRENEAQEWSRKANILFLDNKKKFKGLNQSSNEMQRDEGENTDGNKGLLYMQRLENVGRNDKYANLIKTAESQTGSNEQSDELRKADTYNPYDGKIGNQAFGNTHNAEGRYADATNSVAPKGVNAEGRCVAPNNSVDPGDVDAKGGHFESNKRLGEKAGLSREQIVLMNEGSNAYDALDNQLAKGHAMEENSYEEITQAFMDEYSKAWEFFDLAENESSNKNLKLIYEKKAYWYLGRANHIIGDYRSHKMRGKGNATWGGHAWGVLFPSASADNSENQKWLHENALQASESLGIYFREGKRKFNAEELERILPQRW